MLRAPVTILLLLSPAAPAALAAQDGPVVTEEELVAAVAGDHPAAVAATAERDLAAAEVFRASLLPNPGIEVSREEPEGAARETVAGLTWTPPLGGRRALRREVAAKGLAAAESRLGAAQRLLRSRLREAYAGWALAAQRRELLAAHLGQVGELAGRARARAEAGEIPGLAARRLTLEEAQARSELRLAEARLAGRRAEVAAWLPSLAPGARPVLPALRPGPAATAATLATRPDLAARKREVERAEAQRRLSGRVLDPPTVGLGWMRIEETAGDFGGPVASIGWTLPLFDRRQADRLEAEARLTAARADLSLARARAEAELAGARAAYEQLRREAEESAASAAETETLLAGATAAYQLGEAGLTDFLDSLRTALAARLTALEVREAALAAERDLEAAAGEPLEPSSDAGDLP